jgi:hypothetical protein
MAVPQMNDSLEAPQVSLAPPAPDPEVAATAKPATVLQSRKALHPGRRRGGPNQPRAGQFLKSPSTYIRGAGQ